MLPHDDNLAFGPDKIVMGMWAPENPGSVRNAVPREPQPTSKRYFSNPQATGR